MRTRVRPTTLTALLGLAATLVVGLPVVTPPASAAPPPVPVAPVVRSLPLVPAPVAAGRSGLSTGRVLELPAQSTRPFSTLGVTWAADPAVHDVRVQVRTRSHGTWTPWRPFETGSDDAADPVTADGAAPRAGTEPLWTGPSDGAQVRLETQTGARPRDVRLELVDPGSSPADATTAPAAPSSVASADEGRPAIVSRAAWGADESLRTGSPSYNSTIKAVFVHHTASTSTYTRAQAASMVRGIYAYHTQGRGWSDVGYNILVDKYGRVYEGRAGGLDRFVMGAHTGGFNRDTFGISFLGDWSTVAPPAVAVAAAERVIAWKLASAYRDPSAPVTLVSQGGGTARWPAGVAHTFRTVAGHREAGFTTCPGTPLFTRLPAIRTAVRALMGAGFVGPALTGPRTAPLGSTLPVTVTAGTLGRTAWTLTVTSPEGRVVRTWRGTGTAVSATWDRTDAAGRPVPTGTYALRLTGTAAGDTARAWESTVTVGSPVSLPSGLTVVGPDGRTSLLRDGHLVTPSPALLAATRPDAVSVTVTAAQLAALPAAPATAPQGLAGRGPDGTVRVADGGKVVALSAPLAAALGYATAALPVLTEADFGLPLGDPALQADRHPDGTLVRDGGTVYVLREGQRRPLEASFVPTYGARPVLAPLPGDPAEVGAAAGLADGSVVRTPDGAVHLVEAGVRRYVTAAFRDRLHLPPSRATPVPTAALVATTVRGADLT